MSATLTPTIALDAMGGDVGLDTTLDAAATALASYSDINIILVGDEQAIQAHQHYSKLDKSRIDICATTQVVGMDESPSNVLRHKTDSSMWKAIELVKDGQAQAVVSAGNTGALMATARYILKMLPGISRPAICATMPSQHGHVHWLDLGANIDSKPTQLLQFAVMGSELTKAVDGNDNPQVGLLNVGEEEIKGNETVKETGKLLEASPLNYIGFVEGNDIFLRPQLDVVVCDGFVGNVALKAIEGIAKFIQHSTEQEFKHSLFSKLSALISFPVLRRLKKRIDPRSYNGATLLGLQGIVIKSHGNADAVAFANAIKIARLEIANGVIDQIRRKLEHIQTIEAAEVGQTNDL